MSTDEILSAEVYGIVYGVLPLVVGYYLNEARHAIKFKRKMRKTRTCK